MEQEREEASGGKEEVGLPDLDLGIELLGEKPEAVSAGQATASVKVRNTPEMVRRGHVWDVGQRVQG